MTASEGSSETPRAWFTDSGTLAWRLLGILLLIAAVLWMVAQISLIVITVIVSLLLAATARPLVDRLDRLGLARQWSALLVTAGSILLLVGLLWLIGWRVAMQLPDLIDQVGQAVTQAAEDLPAVSPEQLPDLDSLASQAMELGRSGVLTSGLVTVVEVITGALVAVVLTFFLLRDGRGMWDWALTLLRPELRPRVDAIGRAAHGTLAVYVRGIAIVGLADAVLAGIGLAVLGVPLWETLAVLTFFAAFIPAVGAIVVGALAVGVAFAVDGLTKALIVLALYTVIQQVDGDVLQPMVMGRRLPLHPAAVLLVLTTGGILAGIAGAFLAVPVTAALVAAAHAARRQGPVGPIAGIEGDPEPVTGSGDIV